MAEAVKQMIKKKNQKGRKRIYHTQEERKEANRAKMRKYTAKLVNLGSALSAWERQKVLCGFCTNPEFADHLLTLHNGCSTLPPQNRRDKLIPAGTRRDACTQTVSETHEVTMNQASITIDATQEETRGEIIRDMPEESTLEIDVESVHDIEDTLEESSEELLQPEEPIARQHTLPAHKTLDMLGDGSKGMGGLYMPIEETCTCGTKDFTAESMEKIDMQHVCDLTTVADECSDDIEGVPEVKIDEVQTVPDLNKNQITSQDQRSEGNRNAPGTGHWCDPCQHLFLDREITPHLLSHFKVKLVHCAICVEGFPTEQLMQEHVLAHTGIDITGRQTEGMSAKHFEVSLNPKVREQTVKACPSKCTLAGQVGLNKGDKNHSSTHSRRNKWTEDLPEVPDKPLQLVCCRLCGAGFGLKEDVLKHSQTHFKVTPYKCRLCEKYFNTQDVLTEHETKFCANIKHTCETCRKVFKKREQLLDHQHVHTNKLSEQKKSDKGEGYIASSRNAQLSCVGHEESGKKSFILKSNQCKLCGEQCPSAEDVATHINVHNDKTPHKCGRCLKYFRTQDELTKHQAELCINVVYKCGSCIKAFRTQETLQKHQLRHISLVKQVSHKTLPVYKVTNGSLELVDKLPQMSALHRQKSTLPMRKSTSTIDQPLTNGLQEAPKDPIPETKLIFKCSLCGEKSKSMREAHKHIQVHDERTPYKCHMCSHHFKTERNLKKHEIELCVKLVHECKICSKVFKERETLKRHELVHSTFSTKGGDIANQLSGRKHEHAMRSLISQSNVKSNSELSQAESDSKKLAESVNKSTSDSRSCHELSLSKSDTEQPSQSLHRSVTDPITQNEFSLPETDNEVPRSSVKSRGSASKSVSQETLFDRTVKKHLCRICGEEFSTQRAQREHGPIHKEQTPHKCDMCRKYFQTEEKLADHVKYLHQCDGCGKMLKNKIYSHNCQYLNGSFICENCGKRFRTKLRLDYHMYHHTGKWPFVCSVCNKGYPKQQALDYHMATHTNARPYVCHTCGKSFRNPGCLKIHELTHIEERSVCCDVCGKAFRCGRHMREHKRASHPEQRVICPVCGIALLSKSTLKRHMKGHAGTIKRTHKCIECGVQFCSNYQLVRHVRIHTKQRPHTCDVCGKAFVQKSHLVTHMMGHTGEWSHKCQLCEKGFGNPGHLSKHVADKHGSA